MDLTSPAWGETTTPAWGKSTAPKGGSSLTAEILMRPFNQLRDLVKIVN